MVCRWICLPLLAILFFIAFAVGSTSTKNNSIKRGVRKSEKKIRRAKRSRRDQLLNERIKRIRANKRDHNKKSNRKSRKNRKKLIHVTKNSRNLPINPAIKGIALKPKKKFINKKSFDSDHDGIINERDKCPNVPEDKDGIDDLDGCPE